MAAWSTTPTIGWVNNFWVKQGDQVTYPRPFADSFQKRPSCQFSLYRRWFFHQDKKHQTQLQAKTCSGAETQTQGLEYLHLHHQSVHIHSIQRLRPRIFQLQRTFFGYGYQSFPTQPRDWTWFYDKSIAKYENVHI